MIKTLSLLEEKNGYLEKFIGLNKIEIEKLTKANFADLEVFRENRENILNIIKHIDAMIDVRSAEIPTALIPGEIKMRFQRLLSSKDELVQTILAQDLEIMQIIEAAKSQIIVELQAVRKTKKTISSYKSYNKKESLEKKA